MAASWLFKVASLSGSFNVTSFLIALMTAALTLVLMRTYWRLGLRLPPGPISLPFIGRLFDLATKPRTYFEELRKEYGNICSLYLGARYCVIISGAKLLKQLSVHDEFNFRPPNDFRFTPNAETLASLNGEDWKIQRKFLFRVFRDIGVGNPKRQTAVQVQISEFLEQLRNANKLRDPDGIHMRDFLIPALSSVLFSMLCNRTFQDDENMNQRMIGAFQKSTKYIMSEVTRCYLPLLRVIDFFRGHKEREDYTKCLEELDDTVFREEIEKHEKYFTGMENLDFLDFYIEELRKPNVHKTFSRKNMIGNFKGFTVSGTDSIRLMLEWYLYDLTKNQDIQEKVYQEIIGTIGKERLPRWEERSKMPYLQAVLLEVERWRTPVPLSLPKYMWTDFKVDGYDIPKGTLVTFNYVSVHTDVEVWGDPENFRPERFLTEDGKRINHLEKYIATFGFGKRNCVGEKMSKVNLFFYVTALLQAFRIVPPKNGFGQVGSPAFQNEIDLRIALEDRNQ